MDKVITRIETIRSSGKREGWQRTVKGIVEGQVGAKMYDGEYLKDGEVELEVGTIILRVYYCGAAKRGKGWQEAEIGEVQANGDIKWTRKTDEEDRFGNVTSWDWREESLTLRKEIEKRIAK